MNILGICTSPTILPRLCTVHITSIFPSLLWLSIFGGGRAEPMYGVNEGDNHFGVRLAPPVFCQKAEKWTISNLPVFNFRYLSMVYYQLVIADSHLAPGTDHYHCSHILTPHPYHHPQPIVVSHSQLFAWAFSFLERHNRRKSEDVAGIFPSLEALLHFLSFGSVDIHFSIFPSLFFPPPSPPVSLQTLQLNFLSSSIYSFIYRYFVLT